MSSNREGPTNPTSKHQSSTETSTGEMQIRDLAFNLAGWALKDVCKGEHMYQQINAKSIPSKKPLQWTTAIDISTTVNNGDTADSAFRQSFDLTDEEADSTQPLPENTSRYLIVGYAKHGIGVFRYSKSPSWFSMHSPSKVGTERPDRKDILSGKNKVAFVVVEMMHREVDPAFYVLLFPRNGLCTPYTIARSEIFFRHEFRRERRPGANATLTGRRYEWVSNITSDRILAGSEQAVSSDEVEEPKISDDTRASSAEKMDDNQALSAGTTDDTRASSAGKIDKDQAFSSGTIDDTRASSAGKIDKDQAFSGGTTDDTRASSAGKIDKDQAVNAGTAEDTRASSTGKIDDNRALSAGILDDIAALQRPYKKAFRKAIEYLVDKMEADLKYRPPPTNRGLLAFVEKSVVEFNASHSSMVVDEVKTLWPQVRHMTPARITKLKSLLEAHNGVISYFHLRAILSEGVYRLSNAGDPVDAAWWVDDLLKSVERLFGLPGDGATQPVAESATDPTVNALKRKLEEITK
ncbi:hypothetical protein LTR84_006086 [Exophiala bonariae]|uniref:Uncharacterized protein n=1 Tax=Exophiala bonariae TaxID=1690606 RepID=A0AAV9N1T3_9EURO|nr:hypothetical protein LTR84_006086 [Exophiala bonariae]